MSLLRAFSLGRHIRSLRIPQLAQRTLAMPLARHYSDDASPDSHPAGLLSAAQIRYNRKGRYRSPLTRPDLFTVSEEVKTAMMQMKPILGLETAIYTHGFPKPDNYKLALEMEDTVRAQGATPATIGILNGKIIIGMTPEQLKELAESAGSDKTHKISRRDIAYHIGQAGEPLNGGTTIAGTILLANLCGIRVIATGGLGGVHKGGESSMDVSADLTELSKCSIAVVTSGMKSFLDTARTMEFLETQGVFVSTFGKRTEKVDIPGFFSRESGYPSPYIVESPEEASRIFFANHKLSLQSGNLFFNPIAEEYEIPKSEMDPIIASAVEKASSITGKDNTPAVLNEIVKQTEGRSIEANRQLVLGNAKIGAQMVVELKRLDELHAQNKREQAVRRDINKRIASESRNSKKESNVIKGANGILRTDASNQQTSPNLPSGRRNLWTDKQPTPNVGTRETSGTEAIFDTKATLELENKDGVNEDPKSGDLPATGGVLVVGGVGVDVVGTTISEKLVERTSNPAVITSSVGGVGKNVAATIRQLDPAEHVRFLSMVGKDMNGIMAVQELKRLDLSLQDIAVMQGGRTACYAALNSVAVEGGLSAAVADMKIITEIKAETIAAAIEKYKPRIVCFDGNISADAITGLCKAAKEHGALVVCEPTSLQKSKWIGKTLAELSLELDNPIDMISPNLDELVGIASAVEAAHGLPAGNSDMEEKSRSILKTRSTNYKSMIGFHRESTLARASAQLRSIMPRAPQVPINGPEDKLFLSCVKKSASLLPLVPTIITKLGADGVIIVRLVKHPNPAEGRSRYPLAQDVRDSRMLDGNGKKNMTDLEPRVSVDCFLPVQSYDPADEVIGIHIFWSPAVRRLKAKDVVSSNGAGDTFLGALLHGIMQKDQWLPANIIASPWMYLEGEQLDILVHKAQKAAVRTLLSHESHPIRNESLVKSLKEQEEEYMWAHVTGNLP